MMVLRKIVLALCCVAALTASAADKRIVLVAGPASHGPGQHEHRAGCLLFKTCLDQVPGVTSVVYSNGWPGDAVEAFQGAAAIIFYCDGAAGHPLLRSNRLQTVGALMEKGVGLGCIHFGIEPTTEKGQKEFLDWIGGAFETNWSVNPEWEADFKQLPVHPVTRGVQPFKIRDEWYFHMRFRDGMKGITPILSAVPSAGTTNRADGPHEGNPAMREAVAKGELQTTVWVTERADGGRGFGFSGGHFHKNWADDNMRKLALNAILWVAKVEVPEGGVVSKPTPDQMSENLDAKGRRSR